MWNIKSETNVTVQRIPKRNNAVQIGVEILYSIILLCTTC